MVLHLTMVHKGNIKNRSAQPDNKCCMSMDMNDGTKKGGGWFDKEPNRLRKTLGNEEVK